MNLIYYRNGGPLFVYINAGTIDDTEYIENGLIVNLAQELGGALVTYNHRYYKDNIPTEYIRNNYKYYSNKIFYYKELSTRRTL